MLGYEARRELRRILLLEIYKTENRKNRRVQEAVIDGVVIKLGYNGHDIRDAIVELCNEGLIEQRGLYLVLTNSGADEADSLNRR